MLRSSMPTRQKQKLGLKQNDSTSDREHAIDNVREMACTIVPDRLGEMTIKDGGVSLPCFAPLCSR